MKLEKQFVGAAGGGPFMVGRSAAEAALRPAINATSEIPRYFIVAPQTNADVSPARLFTSDESFARAPPRRGGVTESVGVIVFIVGRDR